MSFTHTLAKADDGTIQITISYPYETITSEKKKALTELAKEVTIDGFRKGKAPFDKIEAKIGASKITEEALSHLVPQTFSEILKTEKLRIAIYPKFDLISSEDGKPWQIRATTCEVPTVELGEYKKYLGNLKEKKQDTVLKALLDNVKINIPKLLIDEEVNARLSGLLERIEKLGLKLESYLQSLGKTPELLRGEYQKQAIESITLELTLSKIAEENKLTVSDSEIEEAIKAATTANKDYPQDQKSMVASILLRNKALEFLLKL